MLGSAKSEHPRLTNREIIFEEFQPIDYDTSTSRTDRQTTAMSPKNVSHIQLLHTVYTWIGLGHYFS